MDFMADLILDDENALSLKYRPVAGFQNWSILTFETILDMISPKIAW